MQGNPIYKTPESTRLHWNYFLALEKDLEAVSRYIEFSADNFATYSIELAHLLLSAASEVDTVAKCICSIIEPTAKAENINDYRRIIKIAEENEPNDSNIARLSAEKQKPIPEVFFHRLSAIKVYVPRYQLEFIPWESWASDKNPDWWHSYNRVKHQRNRYFNEATLKNALHALGALLILDYSHCRYEVARARRRHTSEYKKNIVIRHMDSESTFLRFGRDFYDNPIAELGAYISSVSQDVGRLEGKLDERD